MKKANLTSVKKGQKGENHPAWKGGMSSDSRRRKAIIELLGGRCVGCGFSDIRALQVDHINGGGTKERRKRSNSWYLLKEITNTDWSLKYQLLCANCNWIKRIVNGENRKK